MKNHWAFALYRVQIRRRTLISAARTAWGRRNPAETWRCRRSFSTVAPSSAWSVRSRSAEWWQYSRCVCMLVACSVVAADADDDNELNFRDGKELKILGSFSAFQGVHHYLVISLDLTQLSQHSIRNMPVPGHAILDYDVITIWWVQRIVNTEYIQFWLRR